MTEALLLYSSCEVPGQCGEVSVCLSIAEGCSDSIANSRCRDAERPMNPKVSIESVAVMVHCVQTGQETAHFSANPHCSQPRDVSQQR